jgi:hypothetical protein
MMGMPCFEGSQQSRWTVPPTPYGIEKGTELAQDRGWFERTKRLSEPNEGRSIALWSIEHDVIRQEPCVQF